MALPPPRSSRTNLPAASSGPRRGVPPAPPPNPFGKAPGAPAAPKAAAASSAAAVPPTRNPGSGLRPGVKGSGVRAAAPMPQAEAPDASTRSTRNAIKRKPAARRTFSSGADDGMYRLMRIGIGVVIAIIIGLARGYSHTPSANQNYFNKASAIDDHIISHPESRLNYHSQVDALPISSVTDVQLREYHQALLDMTSISAATETDKQRLMAAVVRHDAVVDQLNAKYGSK